jgi:hypothetical protein
MRIAAEQRSAAGDCYPHVAGDEHRLDEPDDGGMLDDVVDEILGENLPPHKEEDLWERRQRVLETTTTVILALAAVRAASTVRSRQLDP